MLDSENYGQNYVQIMKKSIHCNYPCASRVSGALCDLPEVQNKLNKLKTNTNIKLFPNISGMNQCTMLLLSNLVYPQWISVKCSEAVLPNVVCFTQDNLTIDTNVSLNVTKVCGDLDTIIHGICYKFTWFNGTYMTIHVVDNECKMYRMDLSPVQHGHVFSLLFKASGQKNFQYFLNLKQL